jgi:hypothetical protein
MNQDEDDRSSGKEILECHEAHPLATHIHCLGCG